MTDKERYQRAFSALHTSDGFQVRLEKTKKPAHTVRIRRVLTAACVAMALAAGATAAYASNVGGIQRTIQIWLHGELTDATLDIDGSSGTYAIRDRSGHITQSGGGVAINQDGTERPLTAKEIKEDLANTPDTETVNGRTCLLLGSQRIDITDRFDDSGFCYITVKTGSGKLYVTVRKNGGLASSPNRYLLPDEFAAG
jgi:hypothetical protein